MDPFVIYNDVGYDHLRSVVSNAAYGRQLPKLVESTKVIQITVHFVSSPLLLLNFCTRT